MGASIASSVYGADHMNAMEEDLGNPQQHIAETLATSEATDIIPIVGAGRRIVNAAVQGAQGDWDQVGDELLNAGLDIAGDATIPFSGGTGKAAVTAAKFGVSRGTRALISSSQRASAELREAEKPIELVLQNERRAIAKEGDDILHDIAEGGLELAYDAATYEATNTNDNLPTDSEWQAVSTSDWLSQWSQKRRRKFVRRLMRTKGKHGHHNDEPVHVQVHNGHHKTHLTTDASPLIASNIMETTTSLTEDGSLRRQRIMVDVAVVGTVAILVFYLMRE